MTMAQTFALLSYCYPRWKETMGNHRSDVMSILRTLTDAVTTYVRLGVDVKKMRIDSASKLMHAEWLLTKGDEESWRGYLKLRNSSKGNYFGREARASRDSGFVDVMPSGPPPKLETVRITLVQIVPGVAELANRLLAPVFKDDTPAIPRRAQWTQRKLPYHPLKGPSTNDGHDEPTRSMGPASGTDGFRGALFGYVKRYLARTGVSYGPSECMCCLFCGTTHKPSHHMSACPELANGNCYRVATGEKMGSFPFRPYPPANK